MSKKNPDAERHTNLDHWVDGTSQKARAGVAQLDHGVCFGCGKQCPGDLWVVQHLFPVAYGGRYARYRELITLCFVCARARELNLRARGLWDGRKFMIHDWLMQFVSTRTKEPEQLVVETDFMIAE